MRPGRRLRAWLALMLLAAVAPGCSTLSVQEEEQLGARAAAEMHKELDFVRDEWIVKYVEDIGRDIVAASGDQPYDFRFYVVNNEQLNAFALPAGYIYIHTGIITSAANMSELAGVIGHEVGHVVRRHVAKNYERQRNTGLLYQVGALAASIFVGGYAAAAGQMAGQLAAVAYINTFTREAEADADAFAVDALIRAGYHPEGLVSFFETLAAQGDGGVPEFLRSHPSTDKRIAHTRGLIAAADLPPGLRIDDDGQFEIIQRRVELLTKE